MRVPCFEPIFLSNFDKINSKNNGGKICKIVFCWNISYEFLFNLFL